MKYKFTDKEKVKTSFNVPSGIKIEFLGQRNYYRTIHPVMRNRSGTAKTATQMGIKYALTEDGSCGFYKLPAYYIHGPKRVILVMISAIFIVNGQIKIECIIFANSLERFFCGYTYQHTEEQFWSEIDELVSSIPVKTNDFQMRIPRNRIRSVS